MGCHGVVGPLSHQPYPQPRRYGGVDNVRDRRRDEDVRLLDEQLVAVCAAEPQAGPIHLRRRRHPQGIHDATILYHWAPGGTQAEQHGDVQPRRPIEGAELIRHAHNPEDKVG